MATPNRSPSSRSRRSSKRSAVMPVVAVAVAMAATITAVGIGVSLLKTDMPATSSASSGSQGEESEASSSLPTIAPAVQSSAPPEASDVMAASSSAAASSEAPSSASSNAPASSGSSGESSAAAAPASAAGTFDPSIMGNSGFSNIPNYKQINADVKGWLNIPGTNINYPVLHDERVLTTNPVHYYLDKDIYKQQSKNGVIYADPAVKFGTSSEMSKNTVLFGHNWTNYSANPRIGNAADVMFGQLTAFHHLEFARSHPYLYYSTAEQEMRWVIFAAFYTDINFNYITANPDEAGFISTVSGAKARSRFNYDVTVTTADKILTLSTCTRAYGQSDRQRFVVMARLMRPDETFVPIEVVTNPNPVLPKL